MSPRSVAAVIVTCLALSSTVSAHRLDEYLQATRVAVARDRVTIEMDLAPGVAIAAAVLRSIDRDGDGGISPAEIERYARMVMADVMITIDGEPAGARLLRVDAASWGELTEGVGAIRIEARVDAAMGSGRHLIRVENRHRPDGSVYLANTLVPATRSIEVVEQRRDARQHSIEIDVHIESHVAALPWLLASMTLLGSLVIARRG